MRGSQDIHKHFCYQDDNDSAHPVTVLHQSPLSPDCNPIGPLSCVCVGGGGGGGRGGQLLHAVDFRDVNIKKKLHRLCQTLCEEWLPLGQDTLHNLIDNMPCHMTAITRTLECRTRY